MRNTDKAWAEAVFSFSNKFEANKRLVSPVSGLAVYAKVFAQIDCERMGSHMGGKGVRNPTDKIDILL